MMGTDQFHESVKLTAFTMKSMGIYLEYPTHMTRMDHFKYSWPYIFNLVWMNPEYVAAVLFFVQGLQSGVSFMMLTITLSCFTYCTLGSVKMAILFYYRRSLADLLSSLRTMFPEPGAENDVIKDECMGLLKVSVNTGLEAYLQESSLDEKKVVKTSVYLNFSLVMAFNLSPLVIMTWNCVTTGRSDLILPYFAVYPFDPYNKWIYPLVYVHQCWAGVITIMNLIGPDTLFYVFCSHFRMQFMILERQFRANVEDAMVDGVWSRNPRLKDRNRSTVIRKEARLDRGTSRNLLRFSIRDGSIDFKKHSEILNLLVNGHAKLLDIVSRMDEVYTLPTFGNFVSSSLLICLCGFNAVRSMSTSAWLQSCLFLMTCLAQIFLICYFGDMVVQSSARVCEAIYDSQWYLADTKAKKTILICLSRSQKPCQLTASKFSAVSMNVFSSIIMSSWSYFTLLNSIYSP